MTTIRIINKTEQYATIWDGRDGTTFDMFSVYPQGSDQSTYQQVTHTFEKDSIKIEMQTYDDHIMHFNYEILAQKKDGKHNVYYETDKGFQFYLDKRVGEVMVVHEKSKLVSIYH